MWQASAGGFAHARPSQIGPYAHPYCTFLRRYMFISGDEYDGEWRGGLMSGQGTFVWSGGERYDGNWKV